MKEKEGGDYRAAVEGGVEPSLLVWDRVRQLRRVSLRSSQDPSIAIAVQKGNALAIHAGYSRAIMRAGRGWHSTA